MRTKRKTSRSANGGRLESTRVIAHEIIPTDAAFSGEAVIPHDPEAYARALYAELHRCDDSGAELILIEMPPSGSNGKAFRSFASRPLAVTSPECSAGTTAPKRITPQRLATTTARTRCSRANQPPQFPQAPRHRAPNILVSRQNVWSNIAKSKTTSDESNKTFVCDNHLRSPATREQWRGQQKRTPMIEPARDCFRCAPRNSGRRYSSPAPTPSKRTVR